MLKIIGGEYRSRRLHAPPDETATRPYTSLAKEAVFNLLRGWFEDAKVLDLFAGVGSMGLEAVSRGAQRVLMVEKNRTIYQLLKQNIEDLGCGDRAEAVLADALGSTALLRAPQPVDIVFIDPPFDLMRSEGGRQRVLEQITRCAPIMAEPSFAVLRSPVLADLAEASDEQQAIESLTVEGFDGPEVHRYGRGMFVLLYQPRRETGAVTAAEAAP